MAFHSRNPRMLSCAVLLKPRKHTPSNEKLSIFRSRGLTCLSAKHLRRLKRSPSRQYSNAGEVLPCIQVRKLRVGIQAACDIIRAHTWRVTQLRNVNANRPRLKAGVFFIFDCGSLAVLDGWTWDSDVSSAISFETGLSSSRVTISCLSDVACKNLFRKTWSDNNWSK